MRGEEETKQTMQQESKPDNFTAYKSILNPDLSAEEFARFRDYIAEQSGLYLDESKMDSLRISLLARATLHDFASYLEYLDLLRRSPDELNELLSLITNNETSFFRYPGQFAALKIVLPEIMQRKATTDRRIRIWSAGCSTGEEPYSIGMTVLDYLGDDLTWMVEVLGSDVSKRALAFCESGIYDTRAVKAVDDRLAEKYLEQEADGKWRVGPALRRCVSFGYHNLIKEPYPLAVMANWDIIFCRNVTIYFKLQSTKRVIHNFYRSLNPGGYLFVGHSETLRTINDEFKSVEVGDVFLYRKEPEPEPEPQPVVEESHPGATESAGEAAPEHPDVAATDETRATVATLFDTASEHFKFGRFDDALPLLEQAKDEQPDNGDVRLVLAYVYANKGDYDGAKRECGAALELQPLSARGHYFMGVICEKEAAFDVAEEEFKKTLYIDPDFALAHLNLANIYRAQGNSDLARRSYHNAIDLLLKKPEGDWVEFLGGFLGDLVAETAKSSLKQVQTEDDNGDTPERG